VQATAGFRLSPPSYALGPPRLSAIVERNVMSKPVLQILIALIALSVAHATESLLSVSLAVPTRDGDRWLLLHEKGAHFHVIVSNASDKPQRVWKEQCSWGYYALTFELTDQTGKSWMVEKKDGSWSKNSPDWWSLEPRENLVLDVHFADSEAWEGFPSPVNGSQIVSVRAVFEIKPDKFSTEYGVWTGRITSDAKKLKFYHYRQ
jgi:hypothetical protein